MVEEVNLLEDPGPAVSRHLVKDQVEPVRLFKVLNELDDVLVALTMVEEVNLLEDPGPAVSRHLVNDLDRVLHLGIDVDTSLHRGVCTLAKNLPGQSVDLLECVRCK